MFLRITITPRIPTGTKAVPNLTALAFEYKPSGNSHDPMQISVSVYEYEYTLDRQALLLPAPYDSYSYGVQ